jgi:ABC-type transport system involved in multi-copper enzyme maturation permease subunit
LFAGPIFSREALTAPRKMRHFLLRSGYVAALFVLMYTTRQATIGFQDVRNVGDIARFGSLVFSVFCMVQLSIVMFFALLFTAGNIAQEKDRQTLILLLMTDLRDREMVYGKLGASLLIVGVLIAASLPVFCLVHILGGVSLAQVGWAIAICAATGLAAGAWGALVAFWKDKTFQTLAISVLGIVFFLGVVEAGVAVTGADSAIGSLFALLNPFRAMFGILNPLANPIVKAPTVFALAPVLTMLGLAFLLTLFTIKRLRVWNPSRVNMIRNEEGADGQSRVRHRRIWNNPVIWREIRTRAYGRKVILIKLAYITIAAVVAFYFAQSATAGDTGERILGMISPQGFGFVGLGIISLMLINAQAVTSLTTERDAKTLDLLLCTDITAKEFIFGKLFGSLYNVKELILIPLILVGYFLANRMVPGLTEENTVYVFVGFLVLVVFAAMLGLHAGLSYDNSRSAIANSLGTIFFLFIGIFIFMILLVEADSSFVLQFQSFLVFIGVGSIALYASLTHKNPSAALTMAAGLLPFLTFYAITEFLLGGNLGVCMWISIAYGFTTVAMLVPAVSDFDSALGRTTIDNG